MHSSRYTDTGIFGPGSVHARLAVCADWTPRRGTGPAESFLEDVKEALEDVAILGRADPEADAAWCQQCLPALVLRLLATPWRSLLEAWTRSIHRLGEASATGWSVDDQARLRDPSCIQRVEQQKVLMDAVVVLMTEAFVRHTDSSEPHWVLEPLVQLLNPGQPLYNRPRVKDTTICEDRGFFASMLQRQDRAPKMVRKWKTHASELNQLVWDTFLRLSGPEKIAGIISNAFEQGAGDDCGAQDVTSLFGNIQKLTRNSQKFRDQAAKVCSEMSRLIAVFSAREGLLSPRDIQLLSSMLDAARQDDAGREPDLVENEDYDLLETVDVLQCQDAPVRSIELRPPAVVTVLKIAEGQNGSGVVKPDFQVSQTAYINSGEVTGWIDVQQDPRLRAPTLRRREAALVKVQALVTKTRRWLSLSCLRQSKEDRALRLEALKLMEEFCAQASEQRDQVNWLPRDAFTTVLDEALGKPAQAYQEPADEGAAGEGAEEEAESPKSHHAKDLPLRSVSADNGQEILRPADTDVARLVSRLVELLDAAVNGLTQDPGSEERFSNCGQATISCLHAAALAARAQNLEVSRGVSEVLIRTARCPGSAAVEPVRRGALEALRDMCSSDGPHATWVLEVLTQWLSEASDASDVACDLVAEVSLAAVGRWCESTPATQAMEHALLKHALEMLLFCLSRKLVLREADSATANQSDTVLAARVISRMLCHRPEEQQAQVDALRELLNTSCWRGPLAEQALLQFVLPKTVLLTSGARKLLGEVVLELSRGPMLLQAVRHTSSWLAQIAPPVREDAAGEITWEADRGRFRKRREGGNEPLGLVNDGSTCYLNSVVQQLFWIPPVRSLLAKCDRDLDDPGVIDQLRATFLGLERGEGPSYNPRGLVDACSVLRLEYGVRSQNDAAEFYDQLVDYVQEHLLKDRTGNGELSGKPGSSTDQADGGSRARRGKCSTDEALHLHIADAGAGPKAGGATAPKHAVPPKLSLAGLLRGSRVRHKRCLVCNMTTKVSEEPFFRLEVPTRDVQDGGTYLEYHSLPEALQAMAAPEVMRGENRVECDGCGKRRTETEFRTGISVFPPYLFVQLKRFDFNLRTMRQEKLSHEVSFPFELDMWPYSAEADSLASARGKDVHDATLPAAAPGTAAGAGAGSSPASVSSGSGYRNVPIMQRMISEPLRSELFNAAGQQGPQSDRFMYDLVGVVVHSGMAGGGHYYSLINTQEGEGEGASRRWMEFNDTWVAQLDEKEMVEKYFGDPRTSRCAYLLLYRRRNAVDAVTMAKLQQMEAPRTPPVQRNRSYHAGKKLSNGSAPTLRSHGASDYKALPLRSGEKVSVYSQTQERWVHDGEVCGVIGRDEPGPKGIPPGAIRVRYDCGTREKWVVPEMAARQLMRMAENEEQQEFGDAGLEDGKRILWIRRHAAFSEAFVGFALQLVVSALAEPLPDELDPDEDPALLAARVLFEVIPHFQWEGRFAEWQQVLFRAIWSGQGGARMVCRLLAALCTIRTAPSGPDDANIVLSANADSLWGSSHASLEYGHSSFGSPGKSWLGKMLFECPHKEAIDVATGLVRSTLEWLSPEPEAAAEAVRSVEDFVSVSLRAQAGSPGMAKLAEFLRGVTDCPEACRTLVGSHSCDLIGLLVDLFLDARKAWRKAYPGYQEMPAMVSAKVALNSLAEAVPLNSDVDSLLSVYSRNQLANETLQADCWGQEDCLALVTLTLHIGGESKVQSDIELCLSFTQSNGGDIQLTSRSRDFRFHVQRLRVLLEHHYLPGQGAALTERWRVLARVLSSLQATYLEPNGGADPWATYSRAGIRMISPGIGDSTSRTEHSNASTGDGEVGYCVALLVKELAVLVADLAADPYRQGDLQIVAAAVKQTVSVYRSLADWFLARTQAPCSTNHGALPAAQAALARDAIAAFLQSLGSEVAVHEATL